MRAAPILIALVAASCSGDARDAPFAVADSAGVEVVTTASPPWEATGSPWRLTLRPEIGDVEGEEAYLFGDPVSAVHLPDGRVAVADAQSADIRFFDSTGVFVHRVGTRGQGPGEFESFSWLDRCGEGLMAYDWIQRRATPVTLEGEAGEPFPLETPETGRPPYRTRCLPDGSFLAVGWGEHPSVPAGQDYLFYTQTAELWRLLPGRDSSITIGTYIPSERLAHVDRNTGGGGSGPHPFSRSVVFDGSGDRLLIGGAERLQIEVRTLDGALIAIFRGPDAELLIDGDFVDAYGRAELTPRDSALRRQLADADYPMPERYPAYSDLLVDPLGYVWVERFTLPWGSERRWGVFDPEGVFLGHLDVPANLEITDIAVNHVVGIARDALDVPTVRVYGLDRGGS